MPFILKSIFLKIALEILMFKSLTLQEKRQFLHIRDRYVVLNRIGAGTFSEVYKATDVQSGEIVALKNITRTSSPDRTANEIKFLYMLDGKYNVIPITDAIRFEDQVIAVFPYWNCDEFKTILQSSTFNDITIYIHQLITAMAHTHRNGIIHRDIKPGNFLYNMKLKKGYLIDFGLAHHEIDYGSFCSDEKEGKENILFRNKITQDLKPPGYDKNDTRKQMKAQRAGTRGFRAPEVLFRVVKQTNKIDMWSVGVILLSLMTKQYPFFYSQDDSNALAEIAIIFGKTEMKKTAIRYNRIFQTNLPSIPNERKNFRELILTLNNEWKIDYAMLDLLEGLLELIDERRLSAEDALKHPLFESLNV